MAVVESPDMASITKEQDLEAFINDLGDGTSDLYVSLSESMANMLRAKIDRVSDLIKKLTKNKVSIPELKKKFAAIEKINKDIFDQDSSEVTEISLKMFCSSYGKEFKNLFATHFLTRMKESMEQKFNDKSSGSPKKAGKKKKKNYPTWIVTNIKNLRKDFIDAQKNLVGREKIVNDMMSIIKNFAEFWYPFQEMYLNFIITGTPGIGKSYLVTFIARIFAHSGILYTDEVHNKKPYNFIAEYEGQTATKSKDTLISSLEGVLFVDEAYLLASKQGDKFSSYSDEAVGTIVDFLGEHTGQIVVVMAGYKKTIEETLLTINPGMESRFTQIHLQPYSHEELFKIYQKTLSDYISKSQKNIENFKIMEDAKELLFNYLDNGIIVSGARDMIKTAGKTTNFLTSQNLIVTKDVMNKTLTSMFGKI